MRRLRFIPACLAFLLAACSEPFGGSLDPVPGETGQVRIALSADMRNEIVEAKSESEEKISEDDFWIEIFTQDRRRVYCEKYAVAKDAVLKMNTGDYHLLAKHGDSLGVGFNHAFYMAEKDFTVEHRADNSVSATARLSNVKAKVVFGKNITNTLFYGDCYAVLKNSNPKVKSKLKFKKDEERAGYIPAGELVLEIYAKIDGEYMYYTVEAKTYSPNDFVTFYIDADERRGDLIISIKIDDTVDVVEEVLEIPAENAIPSEAPTITTKAFDNDGSYYIKEGAKRSDSELEMNIDAEAAIQSLTVEIASGYLAGLGIPSKVDLMNIDDATEELLKEAGFVWLTNGEKTYGVLDFESIATSIAKNNPYNGTAGPDAVFTVTVTDTKGRTASETVNIKVELGAAATVSAEDYNVWATKIVDPTVTFTLGEPSETTLEYMQEGQEWTSLGAPKSVSGNTAVFATATGLQPGTPCQFRVVYKDKFYPRGEGTLTTEEAAQLGNSGFEEWTTQVHNYKTKLLWTSSAKRDWYRPWAKESDSWWDVNSQKTLVDETSPQYQWGKCVPTVYYSTDKAVGKYSAQLISTCVCWGANDWGIGAGDQIKAAGEIFIGKSDADGNHASEGHAFPSRPTSLSFKYKYLQHQSDQFHVYMYVADANGNIIASKDFVGGTATPAFMDMTIPFDYSVLNRKAAKIYVCFRSTELADADIEYTKKTISVLGEGKGYVGSILYLDDLKLNY